MPRSLSTFLANRTKKTPLEFAQVEFFYYFWGMNENEYVDYYCQNLLWRVQLDDKTAYYDNDISTLNYDAVLHNAGEFNITKKTFLSAVQYDADKCKEPINLDALWKLSILIWHWKALHVVFLSEIRDVDQYIKLASLLNNGLDVESITITGKFPNKTKRTKIVLSSDVVLSNFLNSMFNDSFSREIMADDNRKHYTLGRMQFTIDVLDKRTIAYQIARELTDFFFHYRGKGKTDEATKNLIMSILSNFSLVTKASNNTDYNKLFSDAKKGRLHVCDNYYQPTLIKGIGILDYTIVKSPDSI